MTLTFITVISVVLLLATATYLFMQQPKFGKAPHGEHLKKIAESPNYRDGIFQNLSPTPDLSDGHSYLTVIINQFFKSHPRTSPKNKIPTTKTDLLSLKENENVLIWFGHSSYFMQMDGFKFLVDPVFCGNASPIPGTVKAFSGTDQYSVNDIPEIDYLLITHDHYDHLDYKTISELEKKVNTVICGLGVGSHFKHWGYPDEKVIEHDWNQQFQMDSNHTIHILPARHFSGRGLSAKNTLWVSYLIETPTRKIYLGGDSGYDFFFKEIGDQFGPIDLVLLDNGQYNDAWKEIHFHPFQILDAARDLKAKYLFPIHSSKFVLAMHSWDEPLKEISRLNEENETTIPLLTPIIGSKIDLDDTEQSFENWWEGVE